MVGPRVAVFGGDARIASRLPPGWRAFESQGFGGNGPVRSLLRAIVAGSIDLVIILARWNGHSTTAAVLDACRRRGIPVRVEPSLSRAIAAPPTQRDHGR